MRELYLECYSGISGDMSVAALLDAGASEEHLRKVLNTMPLGGYRIEITHVKKSGIDACDFNVILDNDNHDHDMEYLHGHSHDNITHQHEHHHEHRGLEEINRIIDSTMLTSGAAALAKKIFLILAHAEAKAHATDIEHVHFHEVGAVDSIVDIVAFAVCFDELKINKVYIPFLYEGYGTIRCQHGIIPVPVPAVSNIVSQYNIVLSQAHIKGELVTPTGAAIVAAIRTDEELPLKYAIQRVGYGAGKREYEIPSMLRAMLIESAQCGNDIGNIKNANCLRSGDADIADTKDCIYKLETDIDDCSAEVLGYTMERLYAAGAREVHYIPIYMKKNRPAYELVVICEKKDIDRLQNIIFTETTTIGIRRCAMERTILKRHMEKCMTPYGEIDVKVCELPDGSKKSYPEYESVKKICESNNVSYLDVVNTLNEMF